MKKVTTLFAATLLLAVGATAQKLSYQAVVRNDANELVTETTLQVAVMVLDASNAVQYAETHANVQTNRNGLLSLMIGDGISMSSNTLADVEWPGASLRTVITLPDNTTITNVTPVNSVPYALYADNVDPDMVSNAIAEYIASHNIGGEDNVQADWNETNQNSDAFIRNKPSLFSGDYNDMTNKPAINNGTLTLQQNGSNVGTFTANQGTDQTLNITTLTAAEVQTMINSGLADLQQHFDSLQAVVADQNAEIAHLNYVIDTLTFHCGISTVTDHEGNVYATVQIGEQCWMRDNLRTTTSPTTGTYLIPAAGTDATYTGKQAFWYNHDSATYAPMNYGLLYNWNAAVDTFNTAYGETSVNTSSSNAVSVTFSGHRRGICPAGWHLPSDAEWTTMEQTQTSMDVSGIGWRGDHAGKLAGDGWNSSSTTGAPGNASDPDHNASGFSAVPAGFCYGSSFYSAGNYAYFWSSTQTNSYDAWSRDLNFYSADVDQTNNRKNDGYSVRCLRDGIPSGGDTPVPQDTTSTPVDTTVTDGQPCPSTPTVTDHEGNVYATVQIGEQCWMRDNLRTTTSPTTGTYLIPAASVDYTYTGKQARWYNNDSATYAPMKYGLLYNWNAAVDTFNTAYGETSVNTDENNAVSVTFSGHRRGICPAGWHLPSDAEWNTMEATVSGSDWQTSYETSNDYRGSHAGKLAGGDNWETSTTSGAPGDYSNAERNVSGFSAVPAGFCYGLSFHDAGYYADFWSASQYSSNFAYYRYLGFYSEGVTRNYNDKNGGRSVRCLRD